MADLPESGQSDANQNGRMGDAAEPSYVALERAEDVLFEWINSGEEYDAKPLLARLYRQMRDDTLGRTLAPRSP